MNELRKIIGQYVEIEEIDYIIEFLYKKDKIKPELIIQNISVIAKDYHTMLSQFSIPIKNYGSKSAHEIFPVLVSPLFKNIWFLSAYPDVYNWVEQNELFGKIKALNSLEELANRLGESEFIKYISNIENQVKFYREVIEQYVNEGNLLECT